MSRILHLSAVLVAMASLLLAGGCSQSAARSKTAGSAPTLSGDQRPPTHGVSDPNAPFTLIDRTKSSPRGPSEEEAGAAPPCAVASLQLYEAAASMDKDVRTVRLAIKNRGASTCRLSGYPGIELQDDHGAAIASIAVRQTGESALKGQVEAPVETAAARPPVDVLIRPAAAASFEISWSSGEACPLVSRLTIRLPQTVAGGNTSPTLEGSLTINRPLNVCNGEIRESALVAAGVI